MKELLKTVSRKVLVALDECSVGVSTKIRKVIALKGSRPEIPTTDRYYCVKIIAPITGSNEVIWQIQEESVEWKTFAKFLKLVKQHYWGVERDVHIILDNAGYHRKNEIRDLAEDLNFKLHFQPSHSPFVNGAEEIWKQLRQFLRSQLFKTLKSLQEAIYDFFIHSPILNIDIVSYLV